MKIETHNTIERILIAMGKAEIKLPDEISDSDYEDYLTITLRWNKNVKTSKP